jgi:hypothetical protein
MKTFLAFILIFSIFVDFSSIGHALEDMLPSYDEVSTCTESDFHSNDEKHSDNHEDHCHCHAGHAHFAVNTFSKPNKSNPISIYQSLISNQHNDKVHYFYSEISRPPIS